MRRVIRGLAPLLCFVLLLSSCGFGRVRLGTAAIGGRYNTFGEAFAKKYKEAAGKEIEVRTTAGSAANLRLLTEGFLELGLAQTDLLEDMAADASTSAGKSPKGYSAIAGLYEESCQIIVRADSAIKEIDDLYDCAVSVGEAESGTAATARRILTAYGISEEHVRAYNLDYVKAAAYLEAGTVDAVFCTAGSAVEAFAKLSEKMPLRLLSIDGREAAGLLRNYSCYQRTVLPENYYKGTASAKTLCVHAVLLAANSMDEAAVKSIAEVLHKNKDELSVDFLTDLELPYHKGAHAYFEEAGLLSADPSGKEG